MSYTMTIESPEKAEWFERRRSKLSQEQLGALFVSFLMQKESEIFELPDDFVEKKVLLQRDALLSVAGGWQDVRSQDEIIADIEGHRTVGRDVAL